MILYLEVEINDLVEQGKKYKWLRPTKCPSCGGLKLWGHGYVERYFDELVYRVWCKRYRCPVCGSVHTLRPKSHYRRFHARLQDILAALWYRIVNNRFSEAFSRQRQQYWWKGFIKQSSTTYNSYQDYTETLNLLITKSIIPVTHSLKYFEIKPLMDTPYLSFSATPPFDSS